MPANRAAWQVKPGAIRPTSCLSTLTINQILPKPNAEAINPADHVVQNSDELSIIYPMMLGEGVAGTVVSVGSAAAARFKPDDRVLAVTIGAALGRPEMSGFEEHVVADAELAR